MAIEKKVISAEQRFSEFSQEEIADFDDTIRQYQRHEGVEDSSETVVRLTTDQDDPRELDVYVERLRLYAKTRDGQRYIIRRVRSTAANPLPSGVVDLYIRPIEDEDSSNGD